MAASAFAFLRGSYPVWLDRFATDAAHDAPPVPLGVGDLHVENFGTWLAPAGEAFGVNDYDETGPVPFTNDLVRLATSAVLAVRAGHLRLDPKDIAEHLWAGYGASQGGAAGVAFGDESVPHVAAVAAMWRAAHPDTAQFWKRIDALPDAPPGASPEPVAGFALHTRRIRTAGLGSRDHLRLMLEGELDGERAAFERKPLGPDGGELPRGRRPEARSAALRRGAGAPARALAQPAGAGASRGRDDRAPARPPPRPDRDRRPARPPRRARAALDDGLLHGRPPRAERRHRRVRRGARRTCARARCHADGRRRQRGSRRLLQASAAAGHLHA